MADRGRGVGWGRCSMKEGKNRKKKKIEKVGAQKTPQKTGVNVYHFVKSDNRDSKKKEKKTGRDIV